MKKLVVFNMLGSTLDRANVEKRWSRWRPSVALAQQADLPISRIEFIHHSRLSMLADTVVGDIATVAPAVGVVRHELDFTDPWDFEEVYGALFDFCQAYPFDTENEDYLFNITTGTHVAQIVWYLLVEARIAPGRILQLSPAGGAAETKAGSSRIIDLDLSRYDALSRRFSRTRLESTSFLKSGIATRNAAFNAMIDEIEKVAVKTKAPVLLMGPTGAGKSQLAQRIFELKKSLYAVEGGLVSVNCATLRGDQAMSALFGHVKGAFTGAAGDRTGYFRAANGGVLFLDEIGELGLDEQAMCLRAIEEKRFYPVGSDREVASDFQLIAGTNRDLAEEVRAGRFREDLYARLNLWTFTLPPLRDRREDVEPNLEFELAKHLASEGRAVTFNKEARAAYLAFATSPEAEWRANFRDLASSVTRMATLCSDGRIDLTVVEAEIARLRSAWGGHPRQGGDLDLVRSVLRDAADGIDPFEIPQLALVIRTCRRSPSLSAAGRELFSVSRATKKTANDADRLKKYLASYGLAFGSLGA